MAVQKTEEKPYEDVPPKLEKITEELSCELNDVEWDNRAREMAEAQEKAEAEEQRKKDVMKQLNADVATAKAKVSKLANIVATKREQRDVVVDVKYDYSKGVVTHTRTDTGQVIKNREMTTMERQGGLFDYEAEENADV